MPIAILLTLTALITATISGAIGLAGGTVLVAVMFAANLSPAVAVPVHAAVQLVSNGSRTVVFGRHVDPRALVVFLIGAAPTPFVVAPWIARVDPAYVRLLMALFVLAVTWLSWVRLPQRLRLPGWVALLAAGVLAGGFGMVVGATGTLIAPFFLRERWSRETIIGTKALCQAAAHMLKIAAFSTQGFAFAGQLTLIAPMSAAVLAGTVLGKRVGERLSERTFLWIFRAVLTVLAFKLLVSASLAIVAAGR